jgi:SAM-dependent methyltransferase
MGLKTSVSGALRRWAGRDAQGNSGSAPEHVPAIAGGLGAAAAVPSNSATGGADRHEATSGGGTQASANRFWDGAHQRDAENRDRPDATPDPLDYTRHPFLYRLAVSEPLTGDPDRFWLDEIGTRYLKPSPGRLLSLGCGIGHAEEHLLSRGYAREIVAYDTSAGAIEAARGRFAGTPWEARIDLRHGSALDDALEPGSFDVVFVEAALHHVIRLEEMFALIHRVLRPDGLFLFDEYVGPDYHIYPGELVGLLNRVNACLGEGYRRDFETGATREQVGGSTPEYIVENDPTEGVHASQILPLTYRFFHVIDRRDYGGALVRPLFCRVISGWDLSDPKDQTVARLVVMLERELTERGAIPTHNAVVVARPRSRPRPPLGGLELERIAFADWPGLRGESRFEPPTRDQGRRKPEG